MIVRCGFARNRVPGKGIETRNIKVDVSIQSWPEDDESSARLRAELMASAPEGQGWGLIGYCPVVTGEQ